MFTSTKTRQIAAELNAAVNAVLEKHGVGKITLDVRRSRDDSFARIMKVDLHPKSEGVKVGRTNDVDPALARAMAIHGIRDVTNAKGDRLTGFNPRRPSYPFSYVSVRGTKWKTSPEMARERFGAK